MSTVATPTSAIASQIPPASVTSSRRTSLDTTVHSSTVSSPALQPTTIPSGTQSSKARRNRAALRDFYGLKDAPAQHPNGVKEGENAQASRTSEAQVLQSELDAPDFDVQAHVKGILERDSLEAVLRAEGGLVGEIKSLDGDRKALVYDNYSRLISATDTIRKMRANMDPLAPTTSTLAPAIAHIAGTAEGLAATARERVTLHRTASAGIPGPSIKAINAGGDDEAAQSTFPRRNEEIRTARWVVRAPDRYSDLISRGQREAAEKDWQDVRILLEKWNSKGVAGVRDMIKKCEDSLAPEN